MCDALIIPDWFLSARCYGGSDLLHTGVGMDCDIGTGRPFLLRPKGELEVEMEQEGAKKQGKWKRGRRKEVNLRFEGL